MASAALDTSAERRPRAVTRTSRWPGMSVADLCEKNARWRIVVRARRNGVEVGDAPCPRFQDQEQLGVSLARRSNAVSRSASVPAIFLGCQTKKAGAWRASTTCFSAGSHLTLISRAVPWFKAH